MTNDYLQMTDQIITNNLDEMKEKQQFKDELIEEEKKTWININNSILAIHDHYHVLKKSIQELKDICISIHKNNNQ